MIGVRPASAFFKYLSSGSDNEIRPESDFELRRPAKFSAVFGQVAASAISVLLACHLWVASAGAQEVLPVPATPFGGQIGLSAKESRPDFPTPVAAPAGAPNVVIVLLDDVGYGASSTFGGPIETPTLDRLARTGLRYTQFHTTALCSPTRAALLTGRNHHSAHTGVIMEQATGYPGYDSLMGKDTATIAEILKQHGWNTGWFGKNHNVPDWQSSQAGPFDLWPTALGFEHFYGFVGAETNQWRPAAFEGTKPIEPYLADPKYNFDYDLADQAIHWVRDLKAVAPDRPFLLYYAPGATHSPHQPRKEWIEKYRGRFDVGWDVIREQTLARQKALGLVPSGTLLTGRPEGIPAWQALTAQEKSLYAYMMEIYAGYLEQTDYNVGRVLSAIDQLGQLDNTLVIYIAGDNGASAEGGLGGVLNELSGINGVPEDLKDLLKRREELGTWKSHNHYPVGWAHAMDTPFQWTKQIASHYGGTANGMVISWPRRIHDQGGIRPQWHHVIDVMPTILDAAGLEQPSSVNGVAQKPIEGVSMAYSFDSPKTPSTRHTQYFEMMGNRAIYHDGWIACTTPLRVPWDPQESRKDVISDYKWELYDVADDFSEAIDVASKYPGKLQELQLLFYAEAARYNVLPLDHSTLGRVDPATRPSLTKGRTEFAYAGAVSRIPEGAAPDIKNKSFTITATLAFPHDRMNGVILTQGGLSGGYALLLRDGVPEFDYNFLNLAHYRIRSAKAIGPGRHVIAFDFKYDGGGIGRGGLGRILVDGEVVAEGRIDRTVPIRFSLDETLDVGEDTGTPADAGYDVPFKFEGSVERVEVTLGQV